MRNVLIAALVAAMTAGFLDPGERAFRLVVENGKPSVTAPWIAKMFLRIEILPHR